MSEQNKKRKPFFADNPTLVGEEDIVARGSLWVLKSPEPPGSDSPEKGNSHEQ